MFADLIIKKDGNFDGNPVENIKEFIKVNYSDSSRFRFRFKDFLSMANKEKLKDELAIVCRNICDNKSHIEANVNGHLNVYDKLCDYDLQVEDSEFVIVVKIGKDLSVDEDGDQDWMDVTGFKFTDPDAEINFYSMSLDKWSNWLNCYVMEENFNEVGIEKFLACCLYDMTFYGYSEEEVQDVSDSIHQSYEEAKAHPERYKSFDNVEAMMEALENGEIDMKDIAVGKKETDQS